MSKTAVLALTGALLAAVSAPTSASAAPTTAVTCRAAAQPVLLGQQPSTSGRGSAAAPSATTRSGQVEASRPGGRSAGARPASRTVRLVTGDVVLLRGTDDVRVLPAQRRGIGRELTITHLGGRVHVVPAATRPYLGRYLDPALFDVTDAAPGARLPVHLELTPGATPHLPGLTLTTRTATSGTGHLTADSSRASGAALARQWAADERAGWPSSSPLFAGVTRIGPDGPPAPASPGVPAFVQATLRVQVLDPAGRAVPYGELALLDTDDARKCVAFVPVVHGEARVSVPLGHYSAVTSVDAVDRRTGTLTSRIVSAVDHVVTRDLCTALRGYDAPTGLGSPRGVGGL